MPNSQHHQTRQDGPVCVVSGAVNESRDRLAKSEQLADRLPSSRGVWRRSLGLVICNTNSSLGVYILRDVRRRCVWAVGAARRSCLPGLRRGGGRQVGATVLSGMAV